RASALRVGSRPLDPLALGHGLSALDLHARLLGRALGDLLEQVRHVKSRRPDPDEGSQPDQGIAVPEAVDPGTERVDESEEDQAGGPGYVHLLEAEAEAVP